MVYNKFTNQKNPRAFRVYASAAAVLLSVLCVLVSAVILSGCTTEPPYTPEPPCTEPPQASKSVTVVIDIHRFTVDTQQAYLGGVLDYLAAKRGVPFVYQTSSEHGRVIMRLGDLMVIGNVTIWLYASFDDPQWVVLDETRQFEGQTLYLANVVGIDYLPIKDGALYFFTSITVW